MRSHEYPVTTSRITIITYGHMFTLAFFLYSIHVSFATCMKFMGKKNTAKSTATSLMVVCHTADIT